MSVLSIIVLVVQIVVGLLFGYFVVKTILPPHGPHKSKFLKGLFITFIFFAILSPIRSELAKNDQKRADSELFLYKR